MSLKDSDCASALGVPQPCSPIIGRRYEASAIRAEGGMNHRSAVAAENGSLRAAGGIPDVNVCIPPVGGDHPACVGTERCRCHAGVTATQDGELLSGSGVPDPRGPVVRCGEDASAIRVGDGGRDWSLVSMQCRDLPAALKQPHGIVVPRHDFTVIRTKNQAPPY